MLMANVQLPGYKLYDNQTPLHITTNKEGVSLSKDIQNDYQIQHLIILAFIKLTIKMF